MAEKVILITGASSGIGLDSAKVLLKQGMIVYGAARRVNKMKVLQELGGRALYMDVTNQESIDKAVEIVMKEQGRIDVLFANAGYALQGPIECVEIDDAKAQYDTNVFGTVRTIKAVLPHMRKAKNGHIIVTSSAAATVTMPGMAWYPSTKHALDAIIGGLRMEMKAFGINVSLLEPSYVDNEFIYPARKTMDISNKESIDSIYIVQKKAIRKNFEKNTISGDSVATITKLIVKAVNDPKPKRYYRAKQTKLLKIIKSIFGYSLLDIYMIKTCIK